LGPQASAAGGKGIPETVLFVLPGIFTAAADVAGGKFKSLYPLPEAHIFRRIPEAG